MHTLIRGVRVFDGAQVIPRTDVLIDDDSIAVYKSQRVDVEIDGLGKTLIPGLIDAHTHKRRWGPRAGIDLRCND
jgi:imidazolonepropionase-like amidohydrolase